MATTDPAGGYTTMTYHQIDTARATIDARLREAEAHRLVRAAQLRNRAERITQRARQALTNLSA